MKNRCLFYLIILFSISVACTDHALNSEKNKNEVTSENFTFIQSSALAEETGQNRSPEISDPFEITDVRIEENDDHKLMYIDVVQEKGCAESYPEKFEVIWDGIMLMIYPPQVHFYLTFNHSECPVLEDNVSETVVLNLDNIFEGHHFEEAIFTVINASKVSSENDQEANR